MTKGIVIRISNMTDKMLVSILRVTRKRSVSMTDQEGICKYKI